MIEDTQPHEGPGRAGAANKSILSGQLAIEWLYNTNIRGTDGIYRLS